MVFLQTTGCCRVLKGIEMFRRSVKTNGRMKFLSNMRSFEIISVYWFKVV